MNCKPRFGFELEVEGWQWHAPLKAEETSSVAEVAEIPKNKSFPPEMPN
jgi:hypothetical protein